MVLGGEEVLCSPLAFLGLILGGVWGPFLLGRSPACAGNLVAFPWGPWTPPPQAPQSWPHILGTSCAHRWELEGVSPRIQTLYNHPP